MKPGYPGNAQYCASHRVNFAVSAFTFAQLARASTSTVSSCEKSRKGRPGESPVLMQNIVSFNLTQRFRSNSRSGPNGAPFGRDMFNEGRPELLHHSVHPCCHGSDKSNQHSVRKSNFFFSFKPRVQQNVMTDLDSAEYCRRYVVEPSPEPRSIFPSCSDFTEELKRPYAVLRPKSGAFRCGGRCTICRDRLRLHVRGTEQATPLLGCTAPYCSA